MIGSAKPRGEGGTDCAQPHRLQQINSKGDKMNNKVLTSLGPDAMVITFHASSHLFLPIATRSHNY